MLVFWELRNKQPIMNLRLFSRRAFAVSCAVMFIFGFVINSTTQLLPQLTQELLGYDATKAGLTLGVGGLISLVVMPAAGFLPSFVQPKWLVMIALAGTGLALWNSAGLDLSMSFAAISLTRMLQVMWMPVLFVSLSTVQFVGVPPEQNSNASAIINMMRNLGGGFGVSLATTLLARRQQFHNARLAVHITPYNGYGAGVSLLAISRAVASQASIMSYLDVFTALGWIALVMCPLCLLLPKVPKGTVSAA